MNDSRPAFGRLRRRPGGPAAQVTAAKDAAIEAMNVCPPLPAVMPRRARIGSIAVACCLVACEAVGTIGLEAHDSTSTSNDDTSTTEAVEDVYASSSSSDDSSMGGSTETGHDMPIPPTSDPASGGDAEESTTYADEGPGTLSADFGTGDADTEEEGGGADGNCCAAQDAPGCDDLVVQSCVCELDPYCCDEAWDEACVNTAKLSECAPACAGAELAQLDCCSSSEVPGCTEPEVQDCVCSVDPFCCAQQWDAACVDHVDELGCGMCPMK